MRKASEGHARYAWIDCFRGFASLEVAIYHAAFPLWIGALAVAAGGSSVTHFDRVVSYLSLPFHYGTGGVILFFLLSGIVIHLPYAGGKRPFGFAEYFVRRFFRVYPPYAVSVLLSYAVLVSVPMALGGDKTWTGVLRSLALIQNYPHGGGPLTGGLADLQSTRNIALWSLPVEFELYLAYPLLLFALRAIRLPALVLGVAAISIVATVVEYFLTPPLVHGTAWSSYLPTFLHYWVVWAAGAWLSEKIVTGTLPRWRNANFAVLAVAGVVSLAAPYRLHLTHDITDFTWGIVFFVVLLWLATHPDRLGTFASNAFRPVRGLGEVSYSLYLVHVPFFYVIEALLLTRHAGKPANYLVAFSAALCAIPIAIAFYYAVERPSIALAHRLAGTLRGRRDRLEAAQTVAKAAPSAL